MNTNLLNLIEKTEETYVKNYSSYQDLEYFVIYDDYELPKMKETNFVLLKKEFNYDFFNLILNKLIDTKQKNNKNYLLIKTDKNIDSYLVGFNYIKNSLYTFGINKSKYNMNRPLINDYSLTLKEFNNELKVNKDIFNDYVNFEFEINDYKDKAFCYDKVKKQVEVLNKNKLLRVFLFYKDNKIIGKAEIFYNGSIVKFEEFAISKRYRNKGVGSFIINSIFRSIFRTRANYIYLVTDSENKESIDLYQKINMDVIDKNYFYFLYW